MLQANVQSYFAINDVQDQLALTQNKDITANRFMSYGTFHTFIKPRQKYGITFGGQFKGLQMDIDRLLRQQVANNNDLPTLKNFVQSQGARQSANEHLVPEQLFDNPDTTEKEVEGVSAVKALQIASKQGQKIFTITKENQAEVLPLLSHNADVMTDIRNALNAGKEVQVHEKTLAYGKWKGTGYVILDPTTGAGAYLIGGGVDGAILAVTGTIILTMAVVAIAEIGVAGFTASVLAGGLGVGIVANHIISMILLGLGAVIAGDALFYQRSKQQCQFGFTLMAGGALASATSLATVALGATSLGSTAQFFLTLLEGLGIRGGGAAAGFIYSDEICEGVNE